MAQVRSKLQTFLKQSSRYDANLVLAQVLNSSFWEEQVVLHSKVDKWPHHLLTCRSCQYYLFPLQYIACLLSGYILHLQKQADQCEHSKVWTCPRSLLDRFASCLVVPVTGSLVVRLQSAHTKQSQPLYAQRAMEAATKPAFWQELPISLVQPAPFPVDVKLHMEHPRGAQAAVSAGSMHIPDLSSACTRLDHLINQRPSIPFYKNLQPAGTLVLCL